MNTLNVNIEEHWDAGIEFTVFVISGSDPSSAQGILVAGLALPNLKLV